MSIKKAGSTDRTVAPKRTAAPNKPSNKTKVQVYASKPAKPARPQKVTQLSDVSKGIILSITKKDNLTTGVDLNPYKTDLVKDFNTMVERSQDHILGLIKLYEGDPDNYYEGKLPYKDKYNKKTKGFGCTKQFVSIRNQEDAYFQLEKDLKDAAQSAKNKINNRLGKGTFEKLKPLSIKEALIDLSFNKGPDKVVRPELLNAIKKNDYSAIVANLYYLYSGEAKNGTEEDPGLYRRSLSRMILATRDLTGKEKTEAEAEIDKFYKRACACFIKNNVQLSELEAIYSYYKTGKSPVAVKSGEITAKVDSVFKGKGGWSIARAAYLAQDTSKMSFQEYYEKFKKINSEEALANIKIGDNIKLPIIGDGKIDAQVFIQKMNKHAEIANANAAKGTTTQEVTDAETEDDGFLVKAGRWLKNKMNSIGSWVKNLFKSSAKEEVKDDTETKTPFQRVITDETVKSERIGEFTLFSMDYTVKVKCETVYGIAKEFDTSKEIIRDDNKLNDKYEIDRNQKLTIHKLGYEIKCKDTLSSIAKKFGLTIEILKDINMIEDVDNIKAGEIIEIPGFRYNVKQGDTLTQIAKKVGVGIQYLKQINGLESDTIKPGQPIIIIYNNADYAVPDSQKKVIVDKTTKTVTETIDMTSRVEGIGDRDLLLTKQRENGKVVPTRKEFSLTAEQKKKAKQPLPLNGKTIIVNAGHGYSEAPNPDVGAESFGRDGVPDEWLCNYDNAMKLRTQLVNLGAKVIFIQGAVNTVAAELERSRNKADMFISVHVNSFKGKTPDRTQIYYTSSKSRVGTSANERSQELARIMETKFDNWIPKHEKISSGDKFIDKGKQDYAQVKSEGLLVCNKAEARYNIPSVLWEVAFMGSHKGRKRLKDKNLMNDYANIMSQSVVEYFKKKS